MSEPVEPPIEQIKRVKYWLELRELALFDALTAPDTARRLAAGLRMVADDIRAHRLLVSDDMGKWTGGPVPADPALAADQRLLRDLRKHALATSPGHILSWTRKLMASESAWQEARKSGDFAKVEKPLADLVADLRRTAAKEAVALGLPSAFDALVHRHAPGLQGQPLEKLLHQAVSFSRAEFPRLAATQGPAPDAALFALDVATQEKLVQRIRERMGVDFSRVKFAQTAHPVTFGGRDTARSSLRFDAGDFLVAAIDAVHETGHVLYRQHLPASHADRPCGCCNTRAADEAMALLMENHVGRSRPFAQFLADELAALGVARPGLTADAIHAKLTRLEQTQIRTYADELTYPRHVALRTELGRRLIDAGLAVKDLPAEWGKAARGHLGAAPAGDKDGVLQDIHWYGGEFGYMPSYFLGQMAAAQIFEAAAQDPAVRAGLAGADFAPLVKWLAIHVYGQGAGHPPAEMVRLATGRELGTQAWADHIQRRYGAQKLDLPPLAPPAAPAPRRAFALQPRP